MKRYLVVDIETLPRPDAELDALAPEFGGRGKTKDLEKIKAQIEEKKASFRDGAGLDAVTGSIALIGLKFDGEKPRVLRCDDAGEEAILREFWNIIGNGTDYNVLVGFNCKGFDFPFLIRRSWMLGVHPAVRVLRPGDGRYWASNVVDLQEEWVMGDRLYVCRRDKLKISLDSMAKALGTKAQKTGDGSEFAELWATDKPKAIAYCADDCEVEAECYERLSLK